MLRKTIEARVSLPIYRGRRLFGFGQISFSLPDPPTGGFGRQGLKRTVYRIAPHQL